MLKKNNRYKYIIDLSEEWVYDEFNYQRAQGEDISLSDFKGCHQYIIDNIEAMIEYYQENIDSYNNEFCKFIDFSFNNTYGEGGPIIIIFEIIQDIESEEVKRYIKNVINKSWCVHPGTIELDIGLFYKNSNHYNIGRPAKKLIKVR